MHTALDVLEHNDAKRRVVVMGDLDAPPAPERPHYRAVGTRVAQVAHRAVFVGEKFRVYRPGVRRGGMPDEHMTHVRTVHEAIAVLQRELCPGDVVLVKGQEQQRLTRIILALAGQEVHCNIKACHLHLVFCERCPLLTRRARTQVVDTSIT
jgi:UDP-N-acetylmuramyl pentapeptide synthase